MTIITADMETLRAAFQAKGYDIRLVGGCVRDMLNGEEPKDIDLCTDASPLEQCNIYMDNKFNYYETGVQHGTVTVVINDVSYEITSLRTETNHDGRHAVVSYTTDWDADLARRDLTINAMAMTFDGDIIDPFGGRYDLEHQKIRFVGEPEQRMKEDYLRILRFFRFHARFAPNKPIDRDTYRAIKRCVPGLKRMSAERIWGEMKRIVPLDTADLMLEEMQSLGINEVIDLPKRANIGNMKRVRQFTRDPVSLIVALLNDADKVAAIGAAWRWSREEQDRAVFIAASLFHKSTDYKWLLANDIPRTWVRELAAVNHDPVGMAMVETCEIPVFPVYGRDLVAKGMKPGPEIGETLKRLKREWAATGYPETMEF